MKKTVFYTEIGYFLGLALLALGTALTAFGGWGISMVVAPAYILHLKISQTLPFFSFGMAEYVLQAVILLLMMLVVRRVKAHYFLSIGAAVLYGVMLDAFMGLVGLIGPAGTVLRLVIYVGGVLLCTAGIALLFDAYLPPEAYELFVKEVSARFGFPLHKFKIAYDCTSLVLAVLLSLVCFGKIQGIGIGTVVCAVLNGLLINMFSKIYHKIWEFRDRFALRSKFMEKESVL